MKNCSVCGRGISEPFHQEPWKTKCYVCYMRDKHNVSFGSNVERIKKLLKKYK